MGSETLRRRHGDEDLLQKARRAESWTERLRAVVRIDRLLRDRLTRDPEAAARLCAALGLLSRRPNTRRRDTRQRGAWHLTAEALESGYGADNWPQLAGELEARLGAWPSSQHDVDVALRYPSRLVTARHLIPPEDVVTEIRLRLTASRGSRRLIRDPRGVADLEAERALSDLPTYERRIALGLLRDQAVFWSPADGRLDAAHPRFDDLVEQPPGTVAVVVRPPASDWELQLKRTGMTGRLGDALKPLSVAATPVPSHRLAGGSTVSALSFEAKASACLSVAYRRLQRRDAPTSRVLGLRVVLTVPSHGGPAFLTDYFTRPELFGPGYGAMRQALHRLIDDEPASTDPFTATTTFLQKMPPAQALLAGTSAWRLDRVADLLSRDVPAGFDDYTAVSRAPTAELDDLLALILGGFDEPTDTSKDRPGAVLAVAENRRRADRIYRRHMQQLGDVWGTVWGLGGHAQGESFVGRNVGLRRVWHKGRADVELVFMDHDNLFLPGPELECPKPQASLAGWLKDELAILGGALRGRYLEGSAELLERIYRIGYVQRDLGRQILQDALTESYRQARTALRENPAVRELFHPEAADHLDRRDEVFRRIAAGPSRLHAETPGSFSPEGLARFAPLLRRYLALFSCSTSLNFEQDPFSASFKGRLRHEHQDPTDGQGYAEPDPKTDQGPSDVVPHEAREGDDEQGDAPTG